MIANGFTGNDRMRAEFERFKQLPDNQVCPTLIDWATGTDEDRHGLALQILRRAGRPAVAEILTQALARRCQPNRRVRLLDALGELGQPLNVLQWSMLAMAARVFGDEVGKKIWEVLLKLGHAVDEGPQRSRALI